uniref:Uncharacterized protein n=1 Tax=Macrostomum lignano TaxID=282301 RepID=A0A1I8FD94_9PLAT
MWMCCRISSVKPPDGQQHIAGGKKASSSSATLLPALCRLRGSAEEKQLRQRHGLQLQQLGLSLAVVGESNSTVRNPDDPYDMDDYEDGHKDCEQYDSASILLSRLLVEDRASATCRFGATPIAHLGSAAPSRSAVPHLQQPSPLSQPPPPQPLAVQHRRQRPQQQRIYFVKLCQPSSSLIGQMTKDC